MSILFENELLVVNPRLAELIGLNEAIILQQMHYWLKKSKHFIDGKDWIYNSAPQWKKQFPFFSESTIKRTIKNLENKGLLFIENYNKDGRDRTKWYSINYGELDKAVSDASCQNGRCIMSNCTDASCQSDTTITRDYTDITTDTNTSDLSLVVDNENIGRPDEDFAEEKTSISDQPKKAKTQNIPYQKITDIYNQVCGGVFKGCLKLDKKRKANIQKCWNLEFDGNYLFHNLDFWEGYFNDCLENKFWCGDNDRGWKADIEFLTRPDKVLKVLEGG